MKFKLVEREYENGEKVYYIAVKTFLFWAKDGRYAYESKEKAEEILDRLNRPRMKFKEKLIRGRL